MNALKGLVIFLGILIVIAMTALAYALYYKSQNPDFKLFAASSPATSPSATSPASPPSAIPPPPLPPLAAKSFGDINLRLPRDGEVKQMTSDGRRLFLHVDGPDGGRVVVIDLANGSVLGNIHLNRAQP